VLWHRRVENRGYAETDVGHNHYWAHHLQGAFAEAQAQYLSPRDTEVKALAEVLAAKKIGVVAHFYMDPQVGRGRGGQGEWTAWGYPGCLNLIGELPPVLREASCVGTHRLVGRLCWAEVRVSTSLACTPSSVPS
jgi:hypothetical protein